MKTNHFLLSSLLVAALFTGCESSEQNGGAGDNPTTIADALTSSISVKAVTPAADRIVAVESESTAKAVQIPGQNLRCPEGYTASSVAFPGAGVAVVSYQAENKTTYKGYLDLVTYDNQGLKAVTSSMELNGRINHVASDGKGRIFIGLDASNGPCIASFSLKDPTHFDENMATLSTIRVNGKSLNAIYYSVEGSKEFLYSATGGDGTVDPNNEDFIINDFRKNQETISLSEYLARSGYQKLELQGTKLIPIGYQGNYNNRGKWIDGKGTQIACMHLSGSYNNYTHANIQYYTSYDAIDAKSPFNQRQIDQKIAPYIKQLEARTMCRFSPYDDLLYVAAADKGLYSYSIDATKKEGLTEVGHYDASVYALDFISPTKVCIAKNDGGVLILSNTNGTFEKASPNYVFSKEEATAHSANYIKVQNGQIFVAYGTGGVVSFKTPAN